MDINLEIEQDLWNSIENNYNKQSYTNAILDAMHLLTSTIRNKTGLEGDGASLIGQAFGGNNPYIRLNNFQTDSEKDFQKGIMEMLKGLYTAIRNPRSHEKISDDKPETDSIIIFINYLLKIIDKSKISFEKSEFIKRVFDQHYVPSQEYSDLLANEIPKRQRADIAISVILERQAGDIDNLQFFISSLFKLLEETEISRIYKVVSEELKMTSDPIDIRTILHICPAKYWCKLDKIVKIRIENIVCNDIYSGSYNSETDKCEAGALGTWIETDHIKCFQDFDTFMYKIIKKLESGNKQEKDYINKYFWYKICKANHDNINQWLVRFITTGLQSYNDELIKKITNELIFEEDHPWWKVFEEELKLYPPARRKPSGTRTTNT